MMREVFQRLAAHYGPQRWWPAETRFEVILGAILTQNTAWSNVEKALSNLRESKNLSLEALQGMSHRKMAELIRPSGYFNQKAERVKVFISFLVSRYQGSLDRMAREETHRLRNELLELRGIGNETADAILLYALDQPVFVVDTYTRRVLSRHGFCSEEISYEKLQTKIEQRLRPNVADYKELHALFVQVGKDFCRKEAHCEGCPLEPLLNTQE